MIDIETKMAFGLMKTVFLNWNDLTHKYYNKWPSFNWTENDFYSFWIDVNWIPFDHKLDKYS